MYFDAYLLRDNEVGQVWCGNDWDTTVIGVPWDILFYLNIF